jgi:hypothetical protein
LTASRPGKAPVTAAKSGWLDRLRRFDVAFPALLWLAVVLWARLVFGFHFVISWGIYQILDRRDLVEHPILSLLMLHAQPPALNAILAFDLQLERWLGIPVEVSLNLLFTLAGTLAAIAVYQVLLWTTRHRAASIAGLILLLVDPAQDYYSSIGAYPFLLYLLCAAYIWFAAAYARDGRTRSFAGLAASTAALALTQTLFHPVWVMATLLLAVGLRIGFRAPRLPVRAGEIRVLLMTAVVLVLWPAKNWLVFRQFTYSSWTGYNLAHTTPMYSRLIDAFNEYGIVDQSRVESYPLPGWIPPAGREMLLRPRKGPEAENTANWNHLIFLVENRELAAVALRWRRQHRASGSLPMSRFIIPATRMPRSCTPTRAVFSVRRRRSGGCTRTCTPSSSPGHLSVSLATPPLAAARSEARTGLAVSAVVQFDALRSRHLSGRSRVGDRPLPPGATGRSTPDGHRPGHRHHPLAVRRLLVDRWRGGDALSVLHPAAFRPSRLLRSGGSRRKAAPVLAPRRMSKLSFALHVRVIACLLASNRSRSALACLLSEESPA